MTLVHGAATAGGAYMPGMSDYVVMVRDRARAFLAGPALLKAATGEIAEDEALGGALMHAGVSGLADYLAEDDADGVRLVRELMERIGWERDGLPDGPAPAYSEEDLLALMPADPRRPVDMREVAARLVDGSDMLEFKPLYGPATLCLHAAILGHRIGILSNNGPLDPDGAAKATHFIQACCQSGLPLVFLQNTTGYIVGVQSERAGMIKHGAKMIQAVATAAVPRLTVICGGSYGAGNYGMCGRGFAPDFLFQWPNARTAVMGAEQAALTMATVMEDSAKARGQEFDQAAAEALRRKVVETFERQSSAFQTSGLMLDDGVIDPRDTRRVLGLALAVAATARARGLNPTSFGVARP
jgi:geranyl-CoA carboxylase beta subunit